MREFYANMFTNKTVKKIPNALFIYKKKFIWASFKINNAEVQKEYLDKFVKRGYRGGFIKTAI